MKWYVVFWLIFADAPFTHHETGVVPKAYDTYAECNGNKKPLYDAFKSINDETKEFQAWDIHCMGIPYVPPPPTIPL